MARLVAVCRDGEEEFPFEKRQIPLYIDDTLTVSACGPRSSPRPRSLAMPGRGLPLRTGPSLAPAASSSGNAAA